MVTQLTEGSYYIVQVLHPHLGALLAGFDGGASFDSIVAERLSV